MQLPAVVKCRYVPRNEPDFLEAMLPKIRANELVHIGIKQLAERVIASLGETCKVAPIRTNYPQGELARGSLLP